jgi:hypothetical protein
MRDRARDATVRLGGTVSRPGRSATEALRVLAICPLLPVDAFRHLAGLRSTGGAYRRLANLRRAGLAEVERAELGYLIAERPCGLWSITGHGRRVLEGASAERPNERTSVDNPGLRIASPRPGRFRGKNLTSLVIAYRLLVFLVAEGSADGQKVDVCSWEQPWVRTIRFLEERKELHLRVAAGAVLIVRNNSAEIDVVCSERKTVVLVPDLGAAPVVRHREMLRRLLQYLETTSDHNLQLVIATVDPDGAGTRAAAWLALLDRVARRDVEPALNSRVVSWGEVLGVLAGKAREPDRGRDAQRHHWWTNGRDTPCPPHGPVGASEQLLHLIGRHPFLTTCQLAQLLGTTSTRIRRIEDELVRSGWLRRVELIELHPGVISLDRAEISRLGLVEITPAGRRRLASWLGLEPTTAAKYHGLISSARSDARRRRRLLRTLAHTVGTNAVFVALAVAADAVRRAGGTDLLAQWRGAAACERKHCKPDGYGCYMRDGQPHGFFLEYDRGIEPARKYRAKFRAYTRYRDSVEAKRDYDGFPTLLFVTTQATAEHRIADEAHRDWIVRGTEALHILLTTTDRIRQHREGILGPIWRTPAPARPGDEPERRYWLPGGTARGRFALAGESPLTPRLDASNTNKLLSSSDTPL